MLPRSSLVFSTLFLTSLIISAFCQVSFSDEVKSRLYRNDHYQFRIKFPEGWKLADGDGKNIIKKAELDGVGSINILVRQGPNKLNSNDLSDAELVAFGKANIQPSLNWGNGELLSVQVVNINNQRAIFTRAKITYKNLSGTFLTINDQYSILKNGYIYVITANCLESKHAELEKVLSSAVDSFVIEDWK